MPELNVQAARNSSGWPLPQSCTNNLVPSFAGTWRTDRGFIALLRLQDMIGRRVACCRWFGSCPAAVARAITPEGSAPVISDQRPGIFLELRPGLRAIGLLPLGVKPRFHQGPRNCTGSGLLKIMPL